MPNLRSTARGRASSSNVRRRPRCCCAPSSASSATPSAGWTSPPRATGAGPGRASPSATSMLRAARARPGSGSSCARRCPLAAGSPASCRRPGGVWTPCRWPGSWSSTTSRNARRRSSPISSPRWSARRPRSPRSGCCCSAGRRPAASRARHWNRCANSRLCPVRCCKPWTRPKTGRRRRRAWRPATGTRCSRPRSPRSAAPGTATAGRRPRPPRPTCLRRGTPGRSMCCWRHSTRHCRGRTGNPLPGRLWTVRSTTSPGTGRHGCPASPREYGGNAWRWLPWPAPAATQRRPPCSTWCRIWPPNRRPPRGARPVNGSTGSTRGQTSGTRCAPTGSAKRSSSGC